MIAQANNLEDLNLIYWGQYLQIPTPTLSHIIHLLAGLFVVVVVGVGFRRFTAQRTHKVKRKTKE